MELLYVLFLDIGTEEWFFSKSVSSQYTTSASDSVWGSRVDSGHRSDMLQTLKSRA